MDNAKFESSDVCVNLRKGGQGCGNFFTLSYALLKIGVCDENHAIACCDLSIDLYLMEFLSFWAWQPTFFNHTSYVSVAKTH